MVLRSKEFDDIYFSPEDGVAETEHVFIKGNKLPDAWQGKERFTIAETGFGTGLNFLVAWELFEKTANASQQLHFISFEKYPLNPDVIRESLKQWSGRFQNKIDTLCAHYPLRISGWHNINLAKNINLVLIFDDLNNVIDELNTGVDAWFLDGFAPSKNPDMWSDKLFEAMNRCALPSTTAATFTAAGLVKRGLAECGFEVTKEKGFGRKRDMITAQFASTTHNTYSRQRRKEQKVAIIGGGLAGCNAAYALDNFGHKVTLFEPENQLASKASGNARGLYNPKFRKNYDPESIFYSTAFAAAYNLFNQFGAEIDFTPCGALHLANTEQKANRFKTLLNNWGWHDDHMQWVEHSESKGTAGISLEHDSLYLPNSGYVSPPKLCQKLTQNIEISYTYALPAEEDFDYIIYATGADFQSYYTLRDLDLRKVRGQITGLNATTKQLPLNTVLCYGGYTTPSSNNTVICGSTFQRWRDDEQLEKEDDIDNLNKLNAVLDTAYQIDKARIAESRAAVRTTTPDHMPAIGALSENELISSGHGSHGLLSSVEAATMLAQVISYGEVLSLPPSTLRTISPKRLIQKD